VPSRTLAPRSLARLWRNRRTHPPKHGHDKGILSVDEWRGNEYSHAFSGYISLARSLNKTITTDGMPCMMAMEGGRIFQLEGAIGRFGPG
jgi:hypothetical protein